MLNKTFRRTIYCNNMQVLNWLKKSFESYLTSVFFGTQSGHIREIEVKFENMLHVENKYFQVDIVDMRTSYNS